MPRRASTASPRIPSPRSTGRNAALGVPLPLWSPASYLRLWRAVRASEVVHVHDSHYPANLVAALAARWMGKRLVVTQHVGFVPYRNPLLRGLVGVVHRIASRLVLRRSDATLFVSPIVRAYFENLLGPCPQFRDLANGVDTSRFAPLAHDRRDALRATLALPAGSPVLLFVGRRVEKKGLDLLHRLAAVTPAWQWCVIGEGPIDPSTWRLPNVRTLGKLPQEAIVDYYRAADVLVLPSVGEGFPLVVQEALSCGLPVAVHTETREAGRLPDEVCMAEPVNGDDAAARWQRRLAAVLDVDVAGEQARRDACRALAVARWSWDTAAEDYAKVLAGRATAA